MQGAPAMIEPRFEHVMSYTAQLTEAEVIGPVSDDLKINFYVTGGTVMGAKVSGKLRAVGGDWLTLRRDGIAILDVRATIETTDNALIYATYPGIIDFGENGYQNFLEGIRPPSGIAIRISPRFQTSHPAYLWLNRLHCIGLGQAFLERSEVAYDVYAVQ
jgi:hypothetical protein